MAAPISLQSARAEVWRTKRQEALVRMMNDVDDLHDSIRKRIQDIASCYLPSQAEARVVEAVERMRERHNEAADVLRDLLRAILRDEAAGPMNEMLGPPIAQFPFKHGRTLVLGAPATSVCTAADAAPKAGRRHLSRRPGERIATVIVCARQFQSLDPGLLEVADRKPHPRPRT